MEDEETLRNFVDEARDHLSQAEPDLLALESDPANSDIINRLFRGIHSIKGAAGFLGLEKINQLTHQMESLLGKLRAGELNFQPGHLDILLQGVDQLCGMVDAVHESNTMDVSPLVSRLKAMLETGSKDTPEEQGQEGSATALGRWGYQFIREKKLLDEIPKSQEIYVLEIDLERDLKSKERDWSDLQAIMAPLGQILCASPEVESWPSREGECPPLQLIYLTIMDADMIQIGLDLDPKYMVPLKRETLEKQEEAANTLPAKAGPASGKQGQDSIETLRVAVSRLNKLLNLAGELVLIRNQIASSTRGVSKWVPSFESSLLNLGGVISELQEEVMNTRMQPLAVLFGKYPRVLRDLCRELKKDIRLNLLGDNVEIDKTVIEALSDPLTHIIRNSADHGIELPEQREAAGKSRQGTIWIEASHESGMVRLIVRDDGGGIDPDRVARKAVDKNLIQEDQIGQMTRQEKLALIFSAGFSTAEKISTVSGRGVGMDVVKSNIEKIGGSVVMDSEPGKGTLLTLSLPLTLAIVPGLVVLVEGQKVVIPQVNIEELTTLEDEAVENAVMRIQGKDILRLREQLIPLNHLADVLGYPRTFMNPIDGQTGSERRQFISDRRHGRTESQDETDRRSGNDRRCIPMYLRVLVVRSGRYRYGIVVDEIVDSHEIVIKPLPKYVETHRCFSGATILGSGEVSLIIDIGGLAEKMKLEEERQPFEKREDFRYDLDMQSFLWFDNGSDEKFAIPLPFIQRIEKINVSQLQTVGSKEYFNYQDTALQVLRLENYLDIQQPRSDTDLTILIPKKVEKPLCILIHALLDTVDLPAEVNQEAMKEEGLVGSALIQGDITLLLDMHSIIEREFPSGTTPWNLKDTGRRDIPRLLLVEDIAFFQVLTCNHLESLGFQVVLAKDGVEALECLNREAFDAVISDIEMPIMNGWELLAHIRSMPSLANLPVIAFTARASMEECEQGLQAGFSHWVTKMERDELVQALKEIFGEARLNKE